MPGYPHLAVVDDEEAIIEILSFSLQKNFPNSTITGFSKADEAWDWLAANEIDLLVTDLNMPEMDGQELVKMMSEKSPEIPVFIISGAYTPDELQNIGTAYNNAQIFPKPLLTRELVAAIKKALAKTDLPSDSQVQEMGLVNFIQMLNLQKKTCTVKIASGENEGKIILKSGDPVLIELDGNPSEESFHALLALEHPQIKLEEIHHDGADQVKQSFSQLLSEFCRRRDAGEL